MTKWIVINEISVNVAHIVSFRTEQVNGAGLRELIVLTIPGVEYRTRANVLDLIKQLEGDADGSH